jgi:hypothetical protein
VRRFFCSERSKDSTLFVLHCRDVQVITGLHDKCVWVMRMRMFSGCK